MKKSPEKKSVKEMTAQMTKVTVDDKKPEERKPTMRKKSMKKVKMTDDQIMAALRKEDMFSI